MTQQTRPCDTAPELCPGRDRCMTAIRNKLFNSGCSCSGIATRNKNNTPNDFHAPSCFHLAHGENGIYHIGCTPQNPKPYCINCKYVSDYFVKQR